MKAHPPARKGNSRAFFWGGFASHRVKQDEPPLRYRYTSIFTLQLDIKQLTGERFFFFFLHRGTYRAGFFLYLNNSVLRCKGAATPGILANKLLVTNPPIQIAYSCIQCSV